MSSMPFEVFPMKDDPFIFFKTTFVTLLYSKTGKFIAKFSIILHAIVIFMQLDYIKNDQNLVSMIEQGPGILVVIFVMSGTAVLIVYESNIKKIFLKISEISWSLHDSHINKVTKSDLFRTKIWILILNFLIGIFAVCRFIEGVQNDSSTISFVPNMFQEYFGGASTYLLLLYLVTLVYLSYTGSLIFVNYTFYAFCHSKIQFAILNKCIYDISKYGTDDMDLYHSEKYQTEIYKKLCFCIERHITLNKSMKEGVAMCHDVYLTVAVTGFLSSISSLLLFFNNISLGITFRFMFVTSLVVIACCLVLTFCDSSQRLTDETESTFELLYNCPWHNWNTKNRKTLLLFMMNTRIPFVFCISGIFEVNLEFLKKYLQCAYSTGMIFNGLQRY